MARLPSILQFQKDKLLGLIYVGEMHPWNETRKCSTHLWKSSLSCWKSLDVIWYSQVILENCAVLYYQVINFMLLTWKKVYSIAILPYHKTKFHCSALFQQKSFIDWDVQARPQTLDSYTSVQHIYTYNYLYRMPSGGPGLIYWNMDKFVVVLVVKSSKWACLENVWSQFVFSIVHSLHKVLG